MILRPFTALLCFVFCAHGASAQLSSQTVNIPQQVVLQGLRSSASYGKFSAAAFETDGSLVLLYDQHDGVRLLKTDAGATTLLAQSQTGAKGDSGLAMALDAAGNIYVTGTTTSGSLVGSSGAAFPARYDTTTNSFLAKYDANLNLQWLTFLGAGATVASGVATNGSGVYVTGLTYSQVFPVTASAIQQTPSPSYYQNGFVESFTSAGALHYATYLNGVNGGTAPAGIAADAAGNAYVTGETSASGFPTIAALVPRAESTTSGFLCALNASGAAFVYSTFLPGEGMTSIALDPSTGGLLLAGDVDAGGFPLTTVAMPMVDATYVTVLRMSLDGQTLISSTPLLPGTGALATAVSDGSVWVSGSVSVPLFPGSTAPDDAAGDSFLLRVNAQGVVDQTLRVGGTPVTNPLYASVSTMAAAPAVNGDEVVLPATVSVSAASSLLGTEHFDLPLVSAPNAVLPSEVSDVLPSATACTNSSECSGSAGLLTVVNTAASAPSLALSVDALPNLTLRNFAATATSGLTITATGYAETNDCPEALSPSAQCGIVLRGSGPGTMTISAANAATSTVSLPASNNVANPTVVSAAELDFGIVTAATAVTRTITVTNLSAMAQTFSSQLESGSSTQFTESATTCGSLAAHSVAANSSCTVTLQVKAASADGVLTGYWSVTGTDVRVSAFSQANALSLSSTAIDFGTQIAGSSVTLPRLLYLSNNGSATLAHIAVKVPSSSSFTATDNCPDALEPRSVCQIAFGYSDASAPADDAMTVTVDGNDVLVTGQTISAASVSGSVANPFLSVSTSSVSFATPVTVTQVSGTQQTVTVSNTGATAFAFTPTVSSDFQLTNPCPATLAGGAVCALYLNFAPSQPGVRDGLLSLATSSSFTPTVVGLSGTGSGILAANNGTIDVGDSYAGEPIQIVLPVTQSLPALTAKVSAPFGVAIVANDGSAVAALPPNAFAVSATGKCNSCSLVVEFFSQSAGAASGTLSLATVANGNPYLLTLTADALPVSGLVLSPLEQDFGTVPVHSKSATQVFELANLLAPASGTAIQSVVASGDFQLATNTSGGASCSGTVAATDACYINVVFTPTATGPRSGTLTVTTSGGTVTAALTGYGGEDPGVSFSPTSLIYRLTPDVSAGSQGVTVTNTGSATLTVGSPGVSSASFVASTACATLAPGANCAVTVNFIPGAGPVDATLTVPVTASLNGQLTDLTTMLALSGTYTEQDAGLEILPAQVNLGAEAPGTMGLTREFTLRNLTAQQMAISLQVPQNFPLAAPAACSTLAAGATCEFSVSFLPGVAGDLTATLFASGASSSGTAQGLMYLEGYGAGTAALTLSGLPTPNSPVTFAQVQSGQTASQTLTVTNSGSAAATVRRVSSEPPFLAATTCGAALAVGQSCTVTVTYAPIDEVAAGADLSPRDDIGSLTIQSDAATSPMTVLLQGSVGPVVSSSPSSGAVLAAYSLSEGALTFANTATGSSSAAQSVTVQNTGTTILHFGAVASPQDFTVTSDCATLAPGSTCSISVVFAPTTTSAMTARYGAVEIASDAAVLLEYISLLAVTSSSPLTLTPTALNFGTVNVGATSSLAVDVTNNTAAPITFTSYSATSGYSAAAGTCPSVGDSLAAGATCALQVTFAPSAAGTQSGAFSLGTSATSLPLTVALTGSAAAGVLTATPSALTFGSVAVASPAPLVLTVVNTGNALVSDVTAAISGVNTSDFTITSPCSSATLAPNQGCTITVTFTPAAIGSRTASLNISSDAGVLAVPLSGTGLQPVGSFVLTVNGAGSASATVTAGVAATFALTLTPLNNFTGAVALTCAPVATVQYASCSLLSPTLTLSGVPQFSTVTINTVTSAEMSLLGMVVLLVVTGAWWKRRGRLVRLMAAVVVCGATLLVGCGGGNSPLSGGGGNLHDTPAGTYQYTVTAASTSGQTVSSSVMLTLVVK